MYLRMMARKKTGIETPISDKNRLAWSKRRPCLFAAKTPIGTPTPTAKISAAIVSSRVAGNRCLISSATLRWVAIELPKSACPHALSCLRYCLYTGSLKPYRCLYCATSAGVARSPRSDEIGVPGSARTQKKTRIETPKRIGRIRSSRRTMYRSIYVVRRLSLFRSRSPDRCVLEPRPADWGRDQVVHLLLGAEERHRVGVRHCRQIPHDQFVDLLVQRDSFRDVRLVRCGRQLLEDRGILESELSAVALEERTDEVIRIAVVTGPADQVEIACRTVGHLRHVGRAPRCAVRCHREA